MTHVGATPRIFVKNFAALMALLVLTVGANFIKLGAFNVAVAMLISVAKATLIILFFMEVRYSKPIVWLFAAAGFIWLLLLLIMIQSDYQTRGWSGQNWRNGTDNKAHVQFNNPGGAAPEHD